MGFIISLFVGIGLGFIGGIVVSEFLNTQNKDSKLYIKTIVCAVVVIGVAVFVGTKSLYYLLSYALGIGVTVAPYVTSLTTNKDEKNEE